MIISILLNKESHKTRPLKASCNKRHIDVIKQENGGRNRNLRGFKKLVLCNGHFVTRIKYIPHLCRAESAYRKKTGLPKVGLPTEGRIVSASHNTYVITKGFDSY